MEGSLIFLTQIDDSGDEEKVAGHPGVIYMMEEPLVNYDYYDGHPTAIETIVVNETPPPEKAAPPLVCYLGQNGGLSVNTPGNIEVRKLFDPQTGEYKALRDKKKREWVTNKINAFTKEKGCQFLTKRDGKNWTEATVVETATFIMRRIDRVAKELRTEPTSVQVAEPLPTSQDLQEPPVSPNTMAARDGPNVVTPEHLSRGVPNKVGRTFAHSPPLYSSSETAPAVVPMMRQLPFVPIQGPSPPFSSEDEAGPAFDDVKKSFIDDEGDVDLLSVNVGLDDGGAPELITEVVKDLHAEFGHEDTIEGSDELVDEFVVGLSTELHLEGFDTLSSYASESGGPLGSSASS